MHKESVPYRGLCTEFYELDKPNAPEDALQCYLYYAEEAQGKILEPMCGTGRFLIPLLERGLKVVGKWQAEPHSQKEANDSDEVILYECVKVSRT